MGACTPAIGMEAGMAETRTRGSVRSTTARARRASPAPPVGADGGTRFGANGRSGLGRGAARTLRCPTLAGFGGFSA